MAPVNAQFACVRSFLIQWNIRADANRSRERQRKKYEYRKKFGRDACLHLVMLSIEKNCKGVGA
jgi:hypothetical protein